jgi:hypothetical protein
LRSFKKDRTDGCNIVFVFKFPSRNPFANLR